MTKYLLLALLIHWWVLYLLIKEMLIHGWKAKIRINIHNLPIILIALIIYIGSIDLGFLHIIPFMIIGLIIGLLALTLISSEPDINKQYPLKVKCGIFVFLIFFWQEYLMLMFIKSQCSTP